MHVGGLLFLVYFTWLNPLVRVVTPPLESASISLVKMLMTCVVEVCLAGGPLASKTAQAPSTEALRTKRAAQQL